MTMMLTWAKALEAGAEVVGGKGLNLARLQCDNFDIPTGGVLSAQVYRSLIAKPEVYALINVIERIATEDLNSIQAQQYCVSLQQVIQGQVLPSEVLDDIRRFLQQLNIGDCALVIRSSATLEDGQAASFAGIHDSFLDVHGEAEIAQAILACIASLWSVRAVSYRRKMNIPDANVAAAVVVCELIHAQVSGVAFSCDPLTGCTDISLINANFGLGESVVAGVTELDQCMFL